MPIKTIRRKKPKTRRAKPLLIAAGAALLLTAGCGGPSGVQPDLSGNITDMGPMGVD